MNFSFLLLNSFSLGAAYALVALGFVLIINTSGAVNFAHGDFVVLGGFVAVGLATLLPVKESIWIMIPVFFIMAGVGGICAGMTYLPLVQRPVVSVFISTIALGMILQNGMLVVFGAEPRAAPSLIGTGLISLGDLRISRQSLAIFLISGVLIGGVQFLLYQTQLGRRLRATAQDVDMARACGISVRKMIIVSFMLGIALAGTAGVLLSYQFFLTPVDGTAFILKAYIAVTIGGWGSILGAVLGAFLIALFETIGAHFLSHPLASAALYLTLLLILIVRPQGLLGEKAKRRA